jgi:hypothetical protein
MAKKQGLNAGNKYTLHMRVSRNGSHIFENMFPNMVTQANLWKWWEECLEDVIKEINDGAREVKFVVTITKGGKKRG